MALSRRTGRSRLTLALLVLTSIAVLTLDFRDAGDRRRAPGGSPARCSRRCGASRETVSEPVRQRVARHHRLRRPRRRRTSALQAPSSTSSRARPCRTRTPPSSSAALLEPARASSGWATSPRRRRASWPGRSRTSRTRSRSTRDPTTGIEVGMPVVNGAGLVGSVVQVTGDRARPCSSSPTPTSRSACRLVPDGALGTARGAGRGRGPPRRHRPRGQTRRSTTGDRAHDERRRPQRLPRRHPGRHGARHPQGRRRAHARPRRASRSPTPRSSRFVTVHALDGGRVTPTARSWSPPAPRCVLVVALDAAGRRGRSPRGARRAGRPHAARRGRRRPGRRTGPWRGRRRSPPGSPSTCCSRRPFGLSALTYALVAYVVGSLQDSVLRAAWWIPVATAAAASAAGCHPVRRVRHRGRRGRSLGVSLLRIALVVGAAERRRGAARRSAPLRWATGTVGRRPRPGVCGDAR